MESVDLQPTVQREEPALGPMRIFCKQNTDLNMAARGDKALLVNAKLEDKSQHWFKRYDVGKLVDDRGSRAFVLVNRTTGEALTATPDPQIIVNDVMLLPYSGHVALKTSMLWSQGGEIEDGFTEIRAFNRISQTLNGIGGNVSNGTVVGLCPSSPHVANAIWKIEPIRINNVV